MPVFFPNIIRDLVREPHHDLVLFLARVHTKTPLQAVLDGEFFRALKGVSRLLDRKDARRHEGAQVLSQMTVCEQEPFTIDVGEMVRVDDAGLAFLFSWFAVLQSELSLA